MKFEVEAQVRTASGKGVARKLRAQGRVPAVLYGQGECVLLSITPELVGKVVKSRAATTGLITVKLAEGKSRTALLRDYQADPVSGEVLHADLFEVSMDKVIRVRVSVGITGGQPAGVKEGGVLHHNLRELHVECLPGAIPESIPVDASPLKIGQGIHLKDVPTLEGVRFLDDLELMVVSVAVPMSEAKLEALLTSGAGGEPGKEPEVVAKGKEAAAAKEGAAPAAGAKEGAAPAAAAKPAAKEAEKKK